jgi:iron complex outermembrane recepter protein
MTYFDIRQSLRLPTRPKLLCQTAIVSLAATFPAHAQEDVIDLLPIVVENELAYSGEIDGYLALATETGVKSGVPLAEVPQSISVVTSTELESRAPRQVEDSIAYVPGVLPSTWGMDNRFDQFAIRGFDMGSSSLYRDGLPQKVLNFSGFTTDPYMIERVDVLRGPAGVLYGSNDAGGMVNLVTKRPVFGRLAEGKIGFDSNGSALVGFDWSNVINEEGTVAARITGLVRDGETEVDRSADDRSFLAGGLTWAPTDNTSLTILGHIQKDSLTPLIFSPVNGEDVDSAWGTLPEGYNLKQSAYNHFDTEQETIGWEFTHSFAPNLTFNQSFRYAHQTTDYAQLDYSSASASGLSYYAFSNDEDAETFGIDNHLKWTTSFGAAKNTLTVGLDHQTSRYDVTQYLDYTMYTVPYSDPNLDFAVADPALGSRKSTEYGETGFYLQDHLDLGTGTKITMGLRHSRFDTTIDDLVASTQSSQKNEATTGMIGVTHEFANGLTPYLSYTEGFTQNVGKTLAGDVLDPSESTQWEAGLRYQPSADLMLSAAVFDLSKTNVKEYDTRDTTWSSFTQTGEVRSRGLELEARGRLNEAVEGVFSYAYLDSKVSKSSNTALIGNHNSMAPPHQLALWFDYDAASFVQGLTVGAGVRYVSSFYATQSNGRKTDGYALADLSLSYEMPEMTVNLDVNNLFDKDYEGLCYDSYGCTKGQGRVISLTLSREF